MKRSLTLLPLMAVTALSLTLGACDDKKSEEQATTTTEGTADTAATATDTTAPSAAPATEQTASVTAESATAYATADGMTTGAVFLTLNNQSGEADRLIGARSTNAASVEMHESTTGEDGTMMMRKIEGIDVPAGQSVTLTPDGRHIMLMGLTAPLKEGESFDLVLDFEKGADVTVPVSVTAPGAGSSATAPAGHDHGTMDAIGTGATSGETTDTGAATGTTEGTTSGTDTGASSSDTSTTDTGSTTRTDAGTGTSTDTAPAGDATTTE
jgi:copper(I)-binding protein